jgi:hypothetical protein
LGLDSALGVGFVELVGEGGEVEGEAWWSVREGSPQCDLEVLLPQLSSLVIDAVLDHCGGVILEARLRDGEGECPREDVRRTT